MFKIKAIATLYVEKNEHGEAEELKTIKLQVPRGTTVRDFVTEALKKAGLGSSFGCVGVQYSSKKFDKFLDVGYDEIFACHQEIGRSIGGEVVAASKKEDDDLSTCKSHGDDDGNTLSCSTGLATEKLDETSEHHATYAEVVKMGAEAKDIEMPEKDDLNLKASKEVGEMSETFETLKQAEEFKEDVEAPKEEQNVSKVTFSEQVVVFNKAEQDVQESEKIGGTASEILPSTPPPVGAIKKGWFGNVFSPSSVKKN
uniref:Uncharacterized protein n=1 Tax=Ditylenchus dipsaci TaxID=166011 RepID=A0A915EL33_9BILA